MSRRSPRKRISRAGILGFLLALAAPSGAVVTEELDPVPDDADARKIAELVENTFRGDTTILDATMTIHSPRLPEPRVVRFQSWDDRAGKRSFIRILGPPKDAGSGFLKLHPNLWMYFPRVERTLRIPPSMMLQSWMGSDFNNDDLVRESSQLDDYDHRILGIDSMSGGEDAKPAWVLEYVPHEEAPVVWGRIVSWVEMERNAPLRSEYYDEEGVMLRIMEYDEIRVVDGRPFPHLWTMTPLDKEGHETRIRIEKIRFEEEIDEAVFTKRHLTRGR